MATFHISSMHRRPGFVVLAAVDQVEAAFETGQPAPVAIVLEPVPRIAAAQIKIAEEHAAQVGEMGDAALARGDRGVERNGADDPDEMLHLDGKEKVKVNDLIGIDQAEGEENAVDAGRRADARRDLIGNEQGVENAAADRRDEIIFEKELAAPAALECATEHPDRQHVEKQMKQPAVEKLIGKELP